MINWRRFFSSRQNWLGLVIMVAFVAVAIAAPSLSPQFDPENPAPYKSVGERFDRDPHPPSATSPLGTTPQLFVVNVGQGHQWDVLHTLVWGTRSALRFGLLVTAVTAVFGVFIGAISGYVGGVANALAMRITDAFLAFPVIAAVWLFQRVLSTTLVPDPTLPPVAPTFWQTVVDTLQIDAVMLALIAFSWMPYARIINASVNQVKQAEFVVAARAMGANGRRILWRHLLPNTLAPAVVLAARDVGAMVILESAFTFIGIGSGNVAWGVMLVAGRDYILGQSGNPFIYWWVFVPISLAIILFSIGANLLGDGLNTLLNPRGAR